jgi:excisionase family DNA binding protein
LGECDGSVTDYAYVLDKKIIRDQVVHTRYGLGVSNAKGESMGNKLKGSPPARKRPDTYSVPEAGRIVGLGKNASYDAVRRGELPVLRFGRILRVPRAALERMLGKA